VQRPYVVTVDVHLDIINISVGDPQERIRLPAGKGVVIRARTRHLPIVKRHARSAANRSFVLFGRKGGKRGATSK
jgi:hypothetical protein